MAQQVCLVRYTKRYRKVSVMFRFILVCIVVVGFLILSIPILLVEWVIGKFNRRAKDISSLRIVQAVFRCVLKITGSDIQIIGHENVPHDTAVLYIGNHRSFFDILLTYVLCPDLTGYVAKKRNGADSPFVQLDEIPALSVSGQKGYQSGYEDHSDCH